MQNKSSAYLAVPSDYIPVLIVPFSLGAADNRQSTVLRPLDTVLILCNLIKFFWLIIALYHRNRISAFHQIVICTNQAFLLLHPFLILLFHRDIWVIIKYSNRKILSKIFQHIATARRTAAMQQKTWYIIIRALRFCTFFAAFLSALLFYPIPSDNSTFAVCCFEKHLYDYYLSLLNIRLLEAAFSISGNSYRVIGKHFIIIIIEIKCLIFRNYNVGNCPTESVPLFSSNIILQRSPFHSALCP